MTTVAVKSACSRSGTSWCVKLGILNATAKRSRLSPPIRNTISNCNTMGAIKQGQATPLKFVVLYRLRRQTVRNHRHTISLPPVRVGRDAEHDVLPAAHAHRSCGRAGLALRHRNGADFAARRLGHRRSQAGLTDAPGIGGVEGIAADHQSLSWLPAGRWPSSGWPVRGW